jgi:two-component system chemotaxis response regulator CheB
MELPTAEHPLRVLLVASPLTCRVARQMLQNSPDIQVCGTAQHGREALLLLPTLRPHVICLADEMPVMSALELTREIMSRYACPILVLQSSCGLEIPDAISKESVFALLQAGAVDVFRMASIVPSPDSPQTRQLISKVKMVSRVPVISRSQRAYARSESEGSVGAAHTLESSAHRPAPRTISLPTKTRSQNLESATSSRIVAIGASTGGPQALLAVLSELPRDYAVPVLCVQHISKGFIGGLVEWLDDQCQIKIRIAQAGEKPQPGTVYFSEEGKHLELDEADGTIRLSLSPAVDGHRPSVTVLFQSVARYSGNRAIAVLLTGMGCDGAQGLKAIHEAQGTTIAQNQESSVVFGMPAAAIGLGAAQHVLPLTSIASKIVALSKF